MNRMIFSALLAAAAALAACQGPRRSAAQPSYRQGVLYVDSKQLPQVHTFKTLAVLPWHVTFNAQEPGRALSQEGKGKDLPYALARYEYAVFRDNAASLRVRVQHPDTTEALLRRAGVTIDSLHYISRQRLLEVLGTDAVLTHDIDVNTYGTTTGDVADVAINVADLLTGPTLLYWPTSSRHQLSVVFSQLYGKGIETPVWSYYGISPFEGGKVPLPPKNSSLKAYRDVQFPLLKAGYTPGPTPGP